MKKILTLAIVAMMVTVARAQFYVGGSIEASTKHLSGNGLSYTDQEYGLAAEVGYNINKLLAVGFRGGAVYEVNGAPGATNYTTWAIMPYARATFAHVGNTHFMTELSYTGEKVKPNDILEPSIKGWAINLSPGILIDLNDHLQLVGSALLFQYGKINNGLTSVEQVNFSLPSELSIGIQYNF